MVIIDIYSTNNSICISMNSCIVIIINFKVKMWKSQSFYKDIRVVAYRKYTKIKIFFIYIFQF